MKQNLSIENIQFIDTYLTKSGIHFTDIKIEMIDHVASEINQRIEDGDTRDFYYIFKDYMVENKAFLIKVEDKFYKASDKKILKSFLKKSCSLKGVLLLLTIFFSFRILENILDLQQVSRIVKYAPFAIMIFGILLYLLLTRIKKERYSSLERIGIYFFVISQINFYSPLIEIEHISNSKLLWSEIGSSIIIFVLIILTASAFELKKEYQFNYNIL